jgi:hypothetical protein
VPLFVFFHRSLHTLALLATMPSKKKSKASRAPSDAVQDVLKTDAAEQKVIYGQCERTVFLSSFFLVTLPEYGRNG